MLHPPSLLESCLNLFKQGRRRPIFVIVVVGLVICAALFRQQASYEVHSPYEDRERPLLWKGNASQDWDFRRDAKRLVLDGQECERFFPGLFQEVDRMVRSRAKKHVTLKELDAVKLLNGNIRVMLHNQELYVIAVEGGIYSRGLAVLHAIHRAVTSSPEPLPNIEFIVSTDDKLPPLPIWSFARVASDGSTWLMPDFGFWSWPETKVGSYGEVQRKAISMEDSLNNPSGKAWAWAAKENKLLWRGAIMGLEVREKFIGITKDKPWADVKSLDWHDKDSMARDLKSMDEHCQYRYLAHTEGNSYSGRLKYLQNCRSVIVAHQMDWIQHYTPLMRSAGPEQNYVKVNRDFANLESTMLELQRDEDMARRIANNSIEFFRERYLTPAAEVCYWRKLINGWADVSFAPDPWMEKNGVKAWRGLGVESYVLERRLEWDPY